MDSGHDKPIQPRRRKRPVRSSPQAADPRVAMVIRIAFFLMFSGLAVQLAYNGRKAIRDRHFDNRWTTTTTTTVNYKSSSQIEHGEDILDGPAAIRFGIGLWSGAALFTGWAIGLARLILSGSQPASKPKWSQASTIATYASLSCVLLTMVCLLPPEHLSSRPFTSAFYGTMVIVTIALLTAMIAGKPKIAAFIFPALAVIAIYAGPLTGGIIFGFFGWLVLAVHVLLLVPALREQAMNAEHLS
jgi:hypothetical protein